MFYISSLIANVKWAAKVRDARDMQRRLKEEVGVDFLTTMVSF